MLTALFDLAVCLGRARGNDVTHFAQALDQMPRLAGETLSLTLQPARRVAARLVGEPWVCFVGAGPNEASARFGAAKFFEGPQILGTATNLEEWAHEEYFVTRVGSPVVVIAPQGASFDRAQEILSELGVIGAHIVLVTDAPKPYGDVQILQLAAGAPEEFTPLLAALPLSLVAFHVSEATGKRSYNFPSEEAEREHYDTIHRDTRGEPA
jgi:glucosamine--fructose-6-phosphate aminotransferase (isomerizing)